MARAPHHIEVLKQKKDHAVFRLAKIGPYGESLIAKACTPPKSLIEHHMYSKVLPRVELDSARLHAFLESGPGGCSWLLLEDVGRTRYQPTDERHRYQAAKWLATFQIATCDIVDPLLPDKSASSYQPNVTALSTRLASCAVDTGDSRLCRLLEDALRLCESVECTWDELEDVCDSAPQTLVHGDCLAKNIHIRREEDELTVVPIDWASAGRGPAATCLGQLDLPRHPDVTSAAQYAAYHEVTRHRWPRFDLDRIGQLAVAGRIFWAVKAIGWGLDSFGWMPQERALADLELYVHALDIALRAADWHR